jgi:hypothetical protein
MPSFDMVAAPFIVDVNAPEAVRFMGSGAPVYRTDRRLPAGGERCRGCANVSENAWNKPRRKKAVVAQFSRGRGIVMNKSKARCAICRGYYLTCIDSLVTYRR